MPFFNNIGGTELLILSVVLFLLFGGKKLSELTKGIGESGKEIKRAHNDIIAALNEEPIEEIDEKNTKKITKTKGGAKKNV